MADAKTRADGYKPIHALTTAEDLVKKSRQLRQGRGALENQWKLNLAFYKGRQYSYINKTTSTIQSLPVDDGEKPRYRVRLVANQIVSGVHSLLAKYTKTKPIISATPGSGSVSDVKAAQMSERLLEYWWDEFSLDAKLEEALLWALVVGQGYWKLSWDPHASKQMRFTLGPDGQPITDDAIKEAFRGQLAAQGVEPVEKIVYLGDIKVEPISPFDVYLDPLAKTFEEATYAICVHHLSPEEVKARWGKDLQPDATSTQADISLPFMSGVASEDTTQKDVRRVYVGYFKPTAALPNGRYVVWVEGPDEILEDTKWPFPFQELPLVKFPGIRVPGSVYDSSHVEQSIPLQKLVNRILSSITEYMNLMLKPRYLAPTGSLRQRLTSEPGQVLEYNPINGLKPEPEQLPTIPPYVFEHLQEVSARLRDVFGLTDVGDGQLPPNLEAGIAIDLLQEMSSDRHAPAIKLLEKALARAGQLMLGLAQKYYIEPRLMVIKGSGGGVQMKKFKGADIAGGVSVHAETGSGLPRTRAGRQARIERLIEMQVLPPDKAYKYLDLADMKSLTAQFAADEDQAQREIEKLIHGAPINPEAVQAAMQAVNQGMNPDTGQPLGAHGNDPMAEAQQVLQSAGLKPLVGENYAVHLDVLGLFMKSVEFESLPPDVRQRFVTHFQLTQQAASALPQQAQPGKVNTNLQIKATLGPTSASKILNRQGIQVTPEEMAEPPLETWVSDSVDKPDTDAAGPGQEANQLTQAAVTVIESQQKIADAQLKAQTVREKHDMDMASKEQELREKTLASADGNPSAREEELHGEALRRARAEADLAEKKLAQSDFKPKRAGEPAKRKKRK